MRLPLKADICSCTEPRCELTRIVSETGDVVARCLSAADARLIVAAVNSHSQLRELIERFVAWGKTEELYLERFVEIAADCESALAIAKETTQ